MRDAERKLGEYSAHHGCKRKIIETFKHSLFFIRANRAAKLRGLGLPMGKKCMRTDEIEESLSRALVGKLGMCSNNQPYVVSVCFLYHDGRIFFHSARQGKKMDFMRANPTVCFQTDEYSLASSSKPCKFSMNYRSVVAVGHVRFLADSKEKLKILKLLVRKYDKGNLAELLTERKTNRVEAGEITISEISGRKNE